MSDTAIIIQLRETINRTENMVPFMRLDMLDLLVSVQCEIETLTDKLKQMQEERDEARREVCNLSAIYSTYYHVDDQAECAKDRGWDCYDEEADHNNESFKKGRMK